jgi:ornithine cyclodeaminase
MLVLGAREVEGALHGREEEVIDAVRRAYEAQARGETSLPHSSFLRFPDSEEDRIISLPAYLGDGFRLAGLKWIASVPGNVRPSFSPSNGGAGRNPSPSRHPRRERV